MPSIIILYICLDSLICCSDEDLNYIGLLQDKIAFIVETNASYKQALDKLAYHPPIPNVLKFCGIENQTIKTLYAVLYVDEQQRKQMLEETKQQCLECFT